MKTIKKIIFSVSFLFNIFPVFCQVEQISDVNISVSSPMCLSHGEEIEVTFNYINRNREGVNIFVRPMSMGDLTPNYSAHGSRLYRAGRGTTTGSFTITSGDILVDEIRIQMISRTGEIVYNHKQEVQFLFTGNIMQTTNPELKTPETVIIINRTILPNGDVEIIYSDGTKKIIFNGGFRIIYPNGTEQLIMAVNVQPNTPPNLPDNSLIVTWLESMNENLLGTIRRLVDMDESVVDYYLQKENTEASDLYKQMELRMTYINFLLSR